MKRLSPEEQLQVLFARIEAKRGLPRWAAWVELMDAHLVDGPCRWPMLCPFCLVARQPPLKGQPEVVDLADAIDQVEVSR